MTFMIIWISFNFYKKSILRLILRCSDILPSVMIFLDPSGPFCSQQIA
jgi:hypothetical protein